MEQTLLSGKHLEAWSGGHWRGEAPAGVRGVSIDSRTVQPGELFVALAGRRVEGHAYIGAAAAAGAAAAMVSVDRAPRIEESLPLLVVPDPREALWLSLIHI